MHGVGDPGFLAVLTAAARKHGVSGYIGDGDAAWSAVHRPAAAQLVRLGLESAPAGSRLHAVAEEAVTTREIAEAIGRALDLPVVSVAPENAVEHFGFIGRFFGLDMSASSALTRELLGWTPSGPTLVEDIEAGCVRVTPTVTAFMLVKTTPEWLALTVEQRIEAFRTEVVPAIEEKAKGVRSRFYDTEFYSARVTDVWVWEAVDHEAYQRLVDALRETPFWDRWFEVAEILVGVENGYANNYGVDAVASITS